MAFMYLMAPCFGCGKTFASNPDFVPSHNDQPVCRDCMELVNAQRLAMGMEPHVIHPEAYEPEEVL